MTNHQLRLAGLMSDYSSWFNDMDQENYEFPEPTARELADKLEAMYGKFIEFRAELQDAQDEVEDDE